ncbi:SpoIIE family protein phosphatase [Leptospira idonii]|uniref:PPM-type phosphatase domain-containing protein n=1 Tax=Leptospira idonii TaxID=1193500 RepID=A0A4R9LW06_9LEPT|nr:SpoIIE family protein phosphatase [Leptospira idonii]TGN17384.1 hypothetical protein EHS15_17780 [Leptospira idonii]
MNKTLLVIAISLFLSLYFFFHITDKDQFLYLCDGFEDVETDFPHKEIDCNKGWLGSSPKSGILLEKKFTFDEFHPQANYAMLLPFYSGGIEVFLNGTRIGYPSDFSSLENRKSIYSFPNVKPIPQGVLAEQNTIRMKLGYPRLNGSFRPIAIGHFQTIHQKWLLWFTRFSSQIAICMFIAAYFCIYFLIRKEEVYLIYFSLISLIVALWGGGYSSLLYYLPIPISLLEMITFSGATVIPMLMLCFFRSFNKQKFNVIDTVAFGIYFLFFAASFLEILLIGSIRNYYTYLFVPFIQCNFLFIIYMTFLCYRLTKKHRQYGGLQLIGFLFILVFYIESAFVFLGYLPWSPLILESFVAFVILFSVILAIHFSETYTALEVTRKGLDDLNHNLEEEVVIRTKQIHDQKEILDRELRIGRTIQSSLLPKITHSDLNKSIAFDYVPCMEIGGDFLDIYYDPSQKKLGIFMCDVSGHGIPAALLASMTKIALHNWVDYIDSPKDMMNNIVQHLKGNLHGNFITAAISTIYLDSGRMITANAGHPETILIRKSGVLERIRPKGSAISDLLKKEFHVAESQLKKGDKVVVYTDGITEAKFDHYSMFGDEEFPKFLQQNKSLGSEKLVQAVFKKLSELPEQSIRIRDDKTLLVFDFSF